MVTIDGKEEFQWNFVGGRREEITVFGSVFSKVSHHIIPYYQKNRNYW